MGLSKSSVQMKIRNAAPDDRNKLANLAHFESFVHRHLDWRGPLDWIGSKPFLVVENKKEIVAALACPPEPPEIAWIRLFSAGNFLAYDHAWEILWPEAQNQLHEFELPCPVAAIPLWPWFAELLTSSGFIEADRVIMLSWQPGSPVPARRVTHAHFRPMIYADLSKVQSIDEAAFGPLWQNSQSSLDLAYRQAAFATIAHIDGEFVGYQLSTNTPMGGHLARLAVHPDHQGTGIGFELVRDTIMYFKSKGAQRISVNTQKSNLTSLSLYRKLGFTLTGEDYPVLLFTITG